MNILFVNNNPINPQIGGIERVTDILIRNLHYSNKYNIFTLCEKTNLSSVGIDTLVKQYHLPCEGGFDIIDNILFYKELLRREKIDIVVNQRGWSSYMDSVLDVDNVKTISVIHTVPKGWKVLMRNEILRHDNTLDGYWRYIVKIIIYPLYRLYKYQKYNDLLESHYRVLLARSSALVVLSNKYINDIHKYARSKCCPIVAIPNPNIYENCAIDGKEKIILYVGRLTDGEKKPIRLLKIWKRIFKQHPDWKLVVVGDGAEKSRMEKYIKTNGLDRVYLKGTRKDVEEYYKKASFVCLTSEIEGWGMSLTEGMSFGCIPFTFNNYGAASDIIDDNVNGCLIKAFNLNEYAAKLSFLMSNSKRRIQMSTEAKKKVLQFSISNVVKEWETLFNTVFTNE